MSFDLSWPKVAALTTVQAAAQTAIGLLTAGATDGTAVDWAHTGYVSGISSLVAFLALIVAYKLPNGPAQAVSAPAPLTALSVTPFAADADEARKT
jgi:hypothetical protein